MLALLLSVLLGLFSVSFAENVDPLTAFGYDSSALVETVQLKDGLLTKHIIRAGEGRQPTQGAQVTAHYTGKLASDGTKFDSSVDRGDPFSFTVGVGQVIKGWDLAFESMKKGEKAVIVIDSSLGYGARGAGGMIGPGASLLFEVELISFVGGSSQEEL